MVFKRKLDEFWSPEPIKAWKAWQLGSDGELILIGGHGNKWNSSELEARHTSFVSGIFSDPSSKRASWNFNWFRKHQSPYLHFIGGCGIYALKEHSDVLIRVQPRKQVYFKNESGKNIGSLFNVVGQVELSGVIYEYEKIYIAQFAKILQLNVFPEIKMLVRRNGLSSMPEIDELINKLEKRFRVPVVERSLQ